MDPNRDDLMERFEVLVENDRIKEVSDRPITVRSAEVRMLDPRGNPQARNLFGILGYLQKHAGVELHVAAVALSAPGRRR
jgi:hypothetical protein